MRTTAFVLAACLWCLPVSADLGSINEQLIIHYDNNNLRIQRNLDAQIRQNDEIIRGRDLTRAIRDLVWKTRDFLRNLKGRQTDQIRGVALTRITNDNTRDMIQRNKLAQQTQKRLQSDQRQAVKARNRDLNQRIRDLSRR